MAESREQDRANTLHEAFYKASDLASTWTENFSSKTLTLSTVQGTPEYWRRYSQTVPPSNPIEKHSCFLGSSPCFLGKSLCFLGNSADFLGKDLCFLGNGPDFPETFFAS